MILMFRKNLIAIVIAMAVNVLWEWSEEIQNIVDEKRIVTIIVIKLRRVL